MRLWFAFSSLIWFGLTLYYFYWTTLVNFQEISKILSEISNLWNLHPSDQLIKKTNKFPSFKSLLIILSIRLLFTIFLFGYLFALWNPEKICILEFENQRFQMKYFQIFSQNIFSHLFWVIYSISLFFSFYSFPSSGEILHVYWNNTYSNRCSESWEEKNQKLAEISNFTSSFFHWFFFLFFHKLCISKINKLKKLFKWRNLNAIGGK